MSGSGDDEDEDSVLATRREGEELGVGLGRALRTYLGGRVSLFMVFVSSSVFCVEEISGMVKEQEQSRLR